MIEMLLLSSIIAFTVASVEAHKEERTEYKLGEYDSETKEYQVEELKYGPNLNFMYTMLSICIVLELLTGITIYVHSH